MAGDTKLFQEALKRGSAHAWNEQWDKAAEEYRRALREFPEDASALTYLAMALYKSGAHQDALELYQALLNSQPANLTMLQRVAELQETVGDNHAAAISYGRLADAHTRRGAAKEAFKAWQKLVALTPGNPHLWNSLIQVAVQIGAVKEIIPGYLGLARDLALQSRFQEAIQVAERAQTLDSESPLVLPMLAAIRKGIEYSFRAASFGEEVYPEDLMRYIPSLEVLQTRLQASTPLMAHVDEPIIEAGVTGPGAGAGGDSLTDSLGGAASVAERMFEIMFRPTSESMDRGITIDSVRDRLGRLGNVVEVQPKVEGRGGIVFVIMLASSHDEGVIRRTIEQSLRPSDYRPEVRAEISQPQQPQSIEVRPVASPPQDLSLPAGELEASTTLEAPPELVVLPGGETEAPEALETELAEEQVEHVEHAEEPTPLAETPEEPAEAAIEPAVEEVLEPADVEPVLEMTPDAEVDQIASSDDVEIEVTEIPIDAELPLPDITWEEFEALTSEIVEETMEPEAGATREEQSVIVEGDSGNGRLALAPEDLALFEVPEEPVLQEGTETAGEEIAEAAIGEEPARDEAGVTDQAGAEDEPSSDLAAEAVAEPEDRLEHLMQRADAARSRGDLDEVAGLYEEAVAANLAGGQQLVELGELYEQMGRRSQAATSFARALDLSPDLPQAMIGLARIDLSDHRLDAAESQVRRALQVSASGHSETGALAVGLLLDIVRERAAYGDLGASAEGLAWLQSAAVVEHLPEPLVERMMSMPRELLGQSVAGHLDEIMALPRYLRGEVTSTLWKAERLMEEGRLRSAADEMFRVVSSYPDFLPAQSLLGRVLVAQGRLDESGRRSRRLLELYELRGNADWALETLQWMTESGLASASDRYRLASLLRALGRGAEAEDIEAQIAAEERAEAERRAAEEAARRAAREAARRTAEAARRAAEEAARRAEEEAVLKAAQDAARRAAAEEAVRRTLDELARQAAEEEARDLEVEAMQAASTSSAEPPPVEIEEQMDAGQTAPEQGSETPPVVETEPSREDVGRKRGGFRGMFSALRGVVRKDADAKPSEQPVPAVETVGVTGHEPLLRLAESRFAFGDAKGAAVLIRSALQDERTASDVPTKVALLRALQVTSPSESGLRDTLQEILEGLGLPRELVD